MLVLKADFGISLKEEIHPWALHATVLFIAGLSAMLQYCNILVTVTENEYRVSDNRLSAPNKP